jgi:acrylyl-CoA reductase (NADPH)
MSSHRQDGRRKGITSPELGAEEIIDWRALSAPAKPLGKERWAGAIDVAGGRPLAGILAHTRYGGAVAACGLVESIDLPATVAPSSCAASP